MRLDLDHGLEELAELDGEAAMAVELHYFGGMPATDIAEAMSLSLRTAQRRLQVGRIWMQKHLRGYSDFMLRSDSRKDA